MMSIDKFSNINNKIITKILTLRDRLPKEQMYCPISIGNTDRTYSNVHFKCEDIGIEKSEAILLEQNGFIKILSNINNTDCENNWGCLIELTQKTIDFEKYKLQQRLEIIKEWIKFLIPIIISTISLIVSILAFFKQYV